MAGLPSRLEKTPLIEVILEFRFETNIQSELMAGAFWASLGPQGKKDFKFERLPVHDLPEKLRNFDPNLLYQPHFRFLGNQVVVMLGARSVAFAAVGIYKDWRTFIASCNELLNKFISLNFTSAFSRIGVRFVNFFQKDVFPCLRYSVNYDSSALDAESINLRIKKKDNENTVLMNFVNDATIARSEDPNLKGKKGSIIDLDCFIERIVSTTEADEAVASLHSSAKKFFFNAIDEDLLNTLSPVYEDE